MSMQNVKNMKNILTYSNVNLFFYMWAFKVHEWYIKFKVEGMVEEHHVWWEEHPDIQQENSS